MFAKIYVGRSRVLLSPLLLDLRGWDQCLSDKKK